MFLQVEAFCAHAPSRLTACDADAEKAMNISAKSAPARFPAEARFVRTRPDVMISTFVSSIITAGQRLAASSAPEKARAFKISISRLGGGPALSPSCCQTPAYEFAHR
jgi:hypothetical protein